MEKWYQEWDAFENKTSVRTRRAAVFVDLRMNNSLRFHLEKSTHEKRNKGEHQERNDKNEGAQPKEINVEESENSRENEMKEKHKTRRHF